MENRRLKSRLFALGAVLSALSSCGSEKVESDKPVELVFEISDSLQIDFLGEMRLQDYDHASDQYLLVSDQSQKYLEVDGQGKIVQDVTLSTDGIDAVSTALGYAYVEGKVVVLTPDKGYMKFESGKKVDEVKIPYSFSAFMFYPKLDFFEMDNKVMYPYLWPDSKVIDFESGDFYQSMYQEPIMQVLDMTTKDTLGTMYLPETSPLKDGKVHGFPIPIVAQKGNEWLLGMWLEPRFYVYAQEGDKITYQKTIELEVPNWVGYKAVESSAAGTFFDEVQKIYAATLEELLAMDEYVLAIYRKGIPEEKLARIDRRTPEGRIEIHRMNPYYVAVFDKNYKLIQADLTLPSGVNGPTVVNKNGELVTSKNPSLSPVEEDGIILYKMKLVEKD
ncbi:hypothetical protein [Algoriphagus sp.]|uniref:hypothetical protein n=1 Tax=Algoriphagus sp. TaxID=1872435 RepID=UPI00391A61BC